MTKEYNYCTYCGSKQKQEDFQCKVCDTKCREFFPETSEYTCSACELSLQSNDNYCCNCGFRTDIPGTITPNIKNEHNFLARIVYFFLFWLQPP